MRIFFTGVARSSRIVENAFAWPFTWSHGYEAVVNRGIRKANLFFLEVQKSLLQIAVKSRISSKLIFASCVYHLR